MYVRHLLGAKQQVEQNSGESTGPMERVFRRPQIQLQIPSLAVFARLFHQCHPRWDHNQNGYDLSFFKDFFLHWSCHAALHDMSVSIHIELVCVFSNCTQP